MTRLVVIRGNAGAGKTTLARALRDALGGRVTIVEQDPFRPVSDQALELIRNAATTALARGDDVIVEGILWASKYRTMLADLTAQADVAVAVYLDVGFDKTLERRAELGEEQLREWWRDRDVLGVAGEIIVGDALTLEQTVALLVDAL